MQLVEGTIDQIMFENFIFEVINAAKRDPKNDGKQMILFCDNARIHKTPEVIKSVQNLGIDVL